MHFTQMKTRAIVLLIKDSQILNQNCSILFMFYDVNVEIQGQVYK